ncbi:MAG: hypothetical protein IT385_20370 [Deltaproteobacteria bacterium]|nr:hypothetical protein [Deltaproteobacteria bacterium]
MGFLDKLKHAVTGGAATVELQKFDGKLEGGQLVFVRVAVTATEDFKSKGVFVDLHGEDDLDENVLDKAAELFNPDPEYTWPVATDVTFEAGQARTFENAIALPATLEPGRTWLARARVEAVGKDPTSAWQKVELVGAPAAS